MKAVFIPHGVSVPVKTLCVDGLISGATATYSHWQGAVVPEELRHDLSTGIVLKAAADPERWLHAFEHVANNHVDVDGLLSMAVALHPELLEHETLLIDAAAYGDFNQYRSEAGARLALCLHQEMRRYAGQYGDGWERKACQEIPDQLSVLIKRSGEAQAERDAQIALIEERIRAIDNGEIDISGSDLLRVVSCPLQHGHHGNDCTDVHKFDDLPLWALNARIHPSAFQLLCLHDEHGTRYQLNAPGHSWAVTSDLPIVPWPDLRSVQVGLQGMEEQTVSWLCGEDARQLDFTCLLASADRHSKPAGSSLAVSDLLAALRPVLS